MVVRNRKLIRIKDYNYCTAGSYFITVCTWRKTCLLGGFKDGKVKLSNIGIMVEKAIGYINEHYENVALDSYTVMPNHIHFIIIIQGPGGYIKPSDSYEMEQPEIESASAPALVSISDIMRNLKSFTANEFYKIHKYTLWHRGYFEHIIRSDKELNEIRQYILDNSVRWLSDKFYLYSDIDLKA